MLLATTGPLGSNWLAHLSSPLAATEPQPYVCLHPEFAAALGLASGDHARLTTRFGLCHVVIRLSAQMVNGLVLAPQLWDSALEGLAPGSLHDCRLEKETKV
jgi:anaerobic selenocysteine-containing dehydrogenase